MTSRLQGRDTKMLREYCEHPGRHTALASLYGKIRKAENALNEYQLETSLGPDESGSLVRASSRSPHDTQLEQAYKARRGRLEKVVKEGPRVGDASGHK